MSSTFGYRPQSLPAGTAPQDLVNARQANRVADLHKHPGLNQARVVEDTQMGRKGAVAVNTSTDAGALRTLAGYIRAMGAQPRPAAPADAPGAG